MKLKSMGSDPEIIVLDNNTLEPFSSESLLDSPLIFEKGFKLHRDNILLEFNIPPAFTLKQWVDYNTRMVNLIKDFLSPKLIISEQIGHTFTQGIDTKFAKKIGCSEDYCIYEHYSPPQNFYSGYRCAGGHVHMGFESPISDVERALILSRLDLYLSIPSLFKEDYNERRRIYGKAGTYRQSKDKTRLEYRTPSNWWIFKEENIIWMYETIHYIIKNIDTLKYDPIDEIAIQIAINDRDLGYAEQLMKKYDLYQFNSQLKTTLNAS